jgi:hypothetical protein
MTTKVKTKKFEGVKTMLSIKAEISEQFAKNPEMILKNLLAIRKKYNLQNADRKKILLIE